MGVVSHPVEMCYYFKMGRGFFLTNPMIFALQSEARNVTKDIAHCEG